MLFCSNGQMTFLAFGPFIRPDSGVWSVEALCQIPTGMKLPTGLWSRAGGTLVTPPPVIHGTLVTQQKVKAKDSSKLLRDQSPA